MCSDIVFVMQKSRKSNGSELGKTAALQYHRYGLRLRLSLCGRYYPFFCHSFNGPLTSTHHSMQFSPAWSLTKRRAPGCRGHDSIASIKANPNKETENRKQELKTKAPANWNHQEHNYNEGTQVHSAPAPEHPWA